MFYNPGNSEYSHENEFQRQQADDGKRIRKPRPKTSVEHSREKDESIPSIKIHGVEFKKNHLGNLITTVTNLLHCAIEYLIMNLIFSPV